MATKSSLALLLLLNLVLCSCVSANCPELTPTPATPSTPKTPAPATPTTPASPAPKKKHAGKCPVNTLKLGACVDLVHNIVNWAVGKPPSEPCCSSLAGLAGLEVAACLCTTIKASVLGINVDVPVTLSLLASTCGLKIPKGYKCA